MTGPTLVPLEDLSQAAECLKVLAHPVRLRMVDILLQGEYAVREIAEFCGLPPNQACEHLRLLKGHGLLGSTRRGREVYYRVVSDRLPRLIDCIRSTCSGLAGDTQSNELETEQQ